MSLETSQLTVCKKGEQLWPKCPPCQGTASQLSTMERSTNQGWKVGNALGTTQNSPGSGCPPTEHPVLRVLGAATVWDDAMRDPTANSMGTGMDAAGLMALSPTPAAPSWQRCGPDPSLSLLGLQLLPWLRHISRSLVFKAPPWLSHVP